MTRFLRFILYAAVSFMLGCSKPPTRAVSIRGPANVVYTVETWEDYGGPLSSDYSRVSAGLVGSGPKDRVLVMDGGYLVISHIDWSAPNNVTFCLSDGHVTTFYTSTVLRGPGGRVELANHLDERCAGGRPFRIK
jgi:hypothetical protein